MESLYERWRTTVAAHRHELALSEPTTDRRWTFQQLAAETEAAPGPTASILYPQGPGADFVLAVLRGWRAGRPVCPLEPGQPEPLFPPPPPGCIHLKTTSATSSAARAIAFTAAQLAADAAQIVTAMGLRPDWPNLGVISLAHSYGFSNLVLPLLLHGIPLILAPTALPHVVKSAVANWPAVTLPAVPVLWRLWHESGAIPAAVRLAISAGAPLPVALEQAVYQASSLKIHNFYGASECGGIAYDASDSPRTEEGYVGRALHSVQLFLSSEACLQVHSAAAGETYWPEPSEALHAGRFRTSDLAELLENRVYLLGRIGDQINIAGRKLAPELVERVIGACPGVEECLVFGVPSRDADRGERVVACVVAHGSLAPETLEQFVNQHLQAWQVPRAWWFLDSLETNQRGKLSRGGWRQRYLEAGGKVA